MSALGAPCASVNPERLTTKSNISILAVDIAAIPSVVLSSSSAIILAIILFQVYKEPNGVMDRYVMDRV